MGPAPSVVDPLDLARWEFFVLVTVTIHERFGDQETIALSRIEDCCRSVDFDHPTAEVDRALFEQVPVRSIPVSPDDGPLPTR